MGLSANRDSFVCREWNGCPNINCTSAADQQFVAAALSTFGRPLNSLQKKGVSLCCETGHETGVRDNPPACPPSPCTLSCTKEYRKKRKGEPLALTAVLHIAGCAASMDDSLVCCCATNSASMAGDCGVPRATPRSPAMLALFVAQEHTKLSSAASIFAGALQAYAKLAQGCDRSMTTLAANDSLVHPCLTDTAPSMLTLCLLYRNVPGCCPQPTSTMTRSKPSETPAWRRWDQLHCVTAAAAACGCITQHDR